MAIPKVTALCLTGLAMLAGAEARLNAPSLDPRTWIPMVDDILAGKATRTSTVASMPDSHTTTTTRMPPAAFLQALAENIYLNKLLFAAERGIHVPEQHGTFTNPVELLENIPFPFSLISNGLKKAAEAAGVDLDAFKRTLQFSYEDKYDNMINHGILPPAILAQAVEDLDPRSFMALVPTLEQDYIQTLREFLPPQLSEIPSVQEVMGAFGVQGNSEAEASLRSLFPFFDIEMIENYMRMATDGLPIPQISARSEGESTEEEPTYRMWIPFLDEVLLKKYLPAAEGTPARPEGPFVFLQDLTQLLPIPAPISQVLGL